MIREAIEKLAKRVALDEAMTRSSFEEIMSGEAAATDIAIFLDLLRKKGETILEITAAAKVMRERSIRIEIDDEAVVDTCGTGGSSINTFNISTTAALVAAGGGAKVAKHGNRSASNQCGSADVLEALGVKIDCTADLAARSIKEIGIGFLFAPIFHTAMKYAARPRKELGGKTIFNILGPLSNPASAAYQVVGVYDAKLTDILANVLKNLGLKRGFVVCGMDGMDEITIAAKTKITELEGGNIKSYNVAPEDFGFKSAPAEELIGGDAKTNAQITTLILKGERSPRRDVVLMNAAAALSACRIAKDFKDGARLAAESIDSGRALDKLTKLIEITNQ